MVRKSEIPKHIIKTALELAAERGWADVSLREIADSAKLSMATLHAHYPSKGAIVEAYARQITETVLADEEAFDPADSARDRLFDVLMRRFDALNENRDAVIAIVRDTPRDPVAGLAMLPVMRESMRWMLEAAGIETEGLQGQARVAGLIAIWLATLRVWMQDETADMAKTMSALDRNLRRAENLARRSSRRRPRTDE